MDSNVRMNLTAVEDEYEQAKSNVVDKEEHLNEARNKRETLLAQLDQMKEELNQLEAEEIACKKKRIRATDLVQILREKKELWLDKKNRMEKTYRVLIGTFSL